MQITTWLPCKEFLTLRKTDIQNVVRFIKCGMNGNGRNQWSCSIILKSIVLVINSHYLLLIKCWTFWVVKGACDMSMKYLISKPVSPNNSNSMFISSLLLQSSQFPSRLWCIWKWDIEKLRKEKVTASSQWCKKERKKERNYSLQTANIKARPSFPDCTS